MMYDPLPTPLGRAMTDQSWADIGLPTPDGDGDSSTVATADFDTTVEQLSSIFETRLADVVADRRRRRRRPSLSEEDERSSRSRSSASSGYNAAADEQQQDDVVLSPACRSELREYVRTIGSMYRACRYHKFEHAAHVTVSAHKLLDMTVERDPNDPDCADDFTVQAGLGLDGERDAGGNEHGPFGVVGAGENPNGVPTVHIDHPKLGEVVRRMSVSSKRGSMDTRASTFSRRRSSVATSSMALDECGPSSSGAAQPQRQDGGEAVAQGTPVCYFEMPSGYTPCTAVSTPEPHVIMRSASERSRRPQSSTFGIDSDPLAKFAVVYAGLVHDVDHQGVPNRQLVAEGDDLAFLYNDKSIAEQHSLRVAFQTLMKPRFASLRRELIPTSSDQFKFRRMVIELVLCTDIASPERMQLTKSKWNEAFGELAPVGPLHAAAAPASSSSSQGGQQQTPGEDAVATVTASRPTVCVPAQRKVRRRASVGVPGYAPSFYPAAGSSGYDNWGGNGQGGNSSVSSVGNSSTWSAAGNSIGGECLGIKRALHLNGSTIEFYAAPGHSPSGSSGHDNCPDSAHREYLDGQERLRASVVMETMMNAADVAHTLQSFENFVKWNRRLYEELYSAYMSGRVQRGESDPADDWYGNQLTFYDIYILPLAAKLRACGSFGSRGEEFLRNAGEIRRRWSEEGMGVTCRIVCEVHAEWEAGAAASSLRGGEWREPQPVTMTAPEGLRA